MSTSAIQERVAHLKLSHGPDGSVLTASVPHDFTGDDFTHLGKSILAQVHRLTGCNCMSGRIKVVIEDNFHDVIQVDLKVDLGKAASGGIG